MTMSGRRCGWSTNSRSSAKPAASLSEEFRSRHPHVPWRAITGMRHHLVHGYFDIDPDIVWVAVTERIPDLKEQILAALASDPAVEDER